LENCIKIPTGFLFKTEGSKGMLETLSIGDYGKEYNIKADFLGFDKEINGVPNMKTKPLSEKWVITLSTQYGCPMKCTFCDVPNIPFNGNATFDDLKLQLFNAIKMFPTVKYTDRLNLHFARMGEPVFNEAVFEFTRWLGKYKCNFQVLSGLRAEVIHPVLTTSLPKGFKQLYSRIFDWCVLKNELFNGQAGLQFSINSTNEDQRKEMFKNKTISLSELSEYGKSLPIPLGRKYCLNFAYSTDFEINAKRLRKLFDPSIFMVKITPIHNNISCRSNNISTIGGYDTYVPYREPEQKLKDVGFDVLIFVPSMDEEKGLVTCGNLVLGGGTVEV
jgi:23S rRNA (adenine2503-C2)-methyltransferase